MRLTREELRIINENLKFKLKIKANDSDEQALLKLHREDVDLLNKIANKI